MIITVDIHCISVNGEQTYPSPLQCCHTLCNLHHLGDALKEQQANTSSLLNVYVHHNLCVPSICLMKVYLVLIKVHHQHVILLYTKKIKCTKKLKWLQKVKLMLLFMHNWLHMLLSIVHGLNYYLIQAFNQMEALCTSGLITFQMGVWACRVLFVWLQILCRQAMNDSQNTQCSNICAINCNKVITCRHLIPAFQIRNQNICRFRQSNLFFTFSMINHKSSVFHYICRLSIMCGIMHGSIIIIGELMHTT